MNRKSVSLLSYFAVSLMIICCSSGPTVDCTESWTYPAPRAWEYINPDVTTTMPGIAYHGANMEEAARQFATIHFARSTTAVNVKEMFTRRQGGPSGFTTGNYGYVIGSHGNLRNLYKRLQPGNWQIFGKSFYIQEFCLYGSSGEQVPESKVLRTIEKPNPEFFILPRPVVEEERGIATASATSVSASMVDACVVAMEKARLALAAQAETSVSSMTINYNSSLEKLVELSTRVNMQNVYIRKLYFMRDWDGDHWRYRARVEAVWLK